MHELNNIETMRLIHRFFLLALLSTSVVVAREHTNPPSIALRTETSFVSEVTLASKNYVEQNQWNLKFVLQSNLHNTSKDEITLTVPGKLAKNLVTNVKYIIAYQTHRKFKENGSVKFEMYADGPRLIRVEGANPAIFRLNDKLKSQLQSTPGLLKSEPLLFIQSIMRGIAEDDPKIQEFFVRELINWDGLHAKLSDQDWNQLFEVFNSSDVSVGSITALLENRSVVHNSIGVDRMGTKVVQWLENWSVDMDAASDTPNMVLTALNFAQANQLSEWPLYSRWTRSNIPSVAEKALLILDQLNAPKTKELAMKRMQETMLSDESRRVLGRYLNNKK